MFHQVLRAGIAAGLVAGIVATALQSGIVTPLIEAAETYETGTGNPGVLAHRHGETTHTHAFGDSLHEHDGHAVILTNGERGHGHGAALAGGERRPARAGASDGGHEHVHAGAPHGRGDEHTRAGAPDGGDEHTRGGALSSDGHGHGHGRDAGHRHGEAWAPEDGLERIAWTAVSNVATAIGFALLLGAIFAWRGGATWRQGLLWGAAGFVVFFANPAIGLHPEVPGAFATELPDRQLWWLFAVVCSGIGAGLLLLAPKMAAKGAGAVLLAVPHLAGAPHPDVVGGLAPQALADRFAIATAVTNCIFWLVLGLSAAVAFRRFVRP